MPLDMGYGYLPLCKLFVSPYYNSLDIALSLKLPKGVYTMEMRKCTNPNERVDSLRTLTQGQCAVGRTPWSAAGPLASLLLFL